MIGDSSGYPKDGIVTTTLDKTTGEVVTTYAGTTLGPSSDTFLGLPMGVGPYTDGTMYSNIFSPGYLTSEQCKKNIFDIFSKLTKYQRESLIHRLEDYKVLSDMVNSISPYGGRYTTLEDIILANTLPEELRQLHAQLLIEEEIK